MPFKKLGGAIFLAMLAISGSACAQEQVVENSESAFVIPNSSKHKIVSQILGRTYEVYVKTPRGYDDEENSDRAYPVIYLNDGPYTFQVASGSTHLPMNSERFDQAILVGISFAEGEPGMHSRVRDFTPALDASWETYETGGAPSYLRFLEEEVIAFVEKEFRADPNQRTLSGQSLGGSFGAWVLFERPDIFANYILTSPSLWFKNRLIFDLEAAYAEKEDDLDATVYFAVGGRETMGDGMTHPMVSQLVEFTDLLRSRCYPNLRLKTEIIPDAIHETTFPQGFMRGTQWLFDQRSEKR